MRKMAIRNGSDGNMSLKPDIVFLSDSLCKVSLVIFKENREKGWFEFVECLSQKDEK